MIIRGLRFKNVFNASGARGFYGEGYWFHNVWRPLGLNYSNSTFVAKTTTLNARIGNMPMNPQTLKPRAMAPKCIVVKPLDGIVLNSVGLSGPGLMRLLPYWEKLRGGDPFFISYMSVEQTPEMRLNEARTFVGRIINQYHRVPQNIGIQLNFSCPNVGLDPAVFANEIRGILDEFQILQVPLLAKLNVTFPHEVALAIEQHEALDGIVMGNTVPWGKLPDQLDWKGMFGSETSPLAHLGGGGLSGKPLLSLTAAWLFNARAMGFRKLLIGGGGVLDVDDANRLLDSGADGIELGSASILRPWRVADIIKHVNMRTGS